jgi:transcriptional regulator with XRE-family HTH domain
MNENTMPRKKRLRALFLKIQDKTDWSSSDLANKIGVSKQTFSNWLNCRVEPDVRHLESIARIASLSLDSLLAYLNGQPAPIEKIGVEEIRRDINAFSILELDAIQSLCQDRMEVLNNFKLQYQEMVSGKRNAPNQLVEMVCTQIKVLGMDQFTPFIFLTPLEFGAFLEGKKPNLAVLGIIAEMLPDKKFSEIQDLANSIYGEKTPPYMFPLSVLKEPDLSENEEDLEFLEDKEESELPEEQGENIPPTQ